MKTAIFIDTETWPFRRGDMAPRVVCLSWSNGDKGILRRDDAWSSLKEWLRQAADGKLVIVGHRVAYDFACIMRTWPESVPLVWAAYSADGISCTRVRERLLDIAEDKLRGGYDDDGQWIDYTYDLDDLSRRYLNRALDKDADGWRLRYSELDELSVDEWPDRAIDYALEDVEVPRLIYEAQNDRARRIHYTMPTEYEEVRAALALQLMSAWGIRTDGPRVRALWERTERRMTQLRSALLEGGLMRPKSPRDREALEQHGLFGGNGHDVQTSKDMKAIRAAISQSWPESLGELPKTAKGAIKTAAEVIEMCDEPALTSLVEFTSLEKSGSTYIRKLFEGIDGPIHAGFDEVGAASDRVTCFKPNLMNQPRIPGVRECFIPRDGRVFATSDFDGQEMRTLAQSCLDIVGRSKLAERYVADVHFDAHQDFANAHGGTRQHAKIANFGIPGGMGVRGLIRYARGYKQTWSTKFAAGIRRSYFEQWPEMNDYFAHVRNVVGDANYGRVIIPQSGFRREGCKYTDAANTYFQTLAAHASKAALFEVSRRCYSVRTSWLYGCRPVVFIHDEIIVEAFEDYAHEAAVEMEQVMVEAMARYTPDVPPAASATLMRRWSKEARRIVDLIGRLTPWPD